MINSSWFRQSEKKDPDTMTIGQLFSPCPECLSDLQDDGYCRYCGGDAPTVQQIAYRRQWLKDHSNETETRGDTTEK